MKHYHRIIYIVAIIPIMFLIIWLINQNFPRSGQKLISQNFFKDQPMISRFGPEGRIIIKNNLSVIVDHPVYFDLRTMPWFNQALIKIVYQSNGRELEGIAGQVGAGWQYDLKKPLLKKNLTNNFFEADFIFNLNALYNQKNIRRFLVATKKIGDQNSNELIIKSLDIILTR